jgi:methylated-DNA-protein-cysteine methyltransferase-like protein
MNGVLNQDLVYEVLSVVEEIPAGRVATYGQIARLTGRDRNARLVGKILSMSAYYGQYPCHRVVNHAGRTAPVFHAQRELLENEGVKFRMNGSVDLKKYQWDC